MLQGACILNMAAPLSPGLNLLSGVVLLIICKGRRGPAWVMRVHRRMILIVEMVKKWVELAWLPLLRLCAHVPVLRCVPPGPHIPSTQLWHNATARAAHLADFRLILPASGLQVQTEYSIYIL